MKLQILNYGFTVSHDLIRNLPDFHDPESISDSDAFLLDPHIFRTAGQLNGDAFSRRQSEIRNLVQIKGGIVICALRLNDALSVGNSGGCTKYSLVDSLQPKAQSLIRGVVRAGEGSQIMLVSQAKGALSGYFRVLRDNLRFAAYLDTGETNIASADGTVFAVDSVGFPVAVEFSVGGGRLCFVPIPHGVPGDRVGSAIVRVVEAHYGGSGDVDAPSWVKDVVVPRADAQDARIAELAIKRDQITNEIDGLEQIRSTLLNYRRLLFGTGKSELEPVVREAFSLLGFKVPEPSSYQGEWDVELTETGSEKTAIGEVEGSEGLIDVDKYRQLLDYYQAEVLEGRVRKGILIGNGFRLKALDAPERQNQFSEHAIRGAMANGFCLLPTTELFKAVCAVLETSDTEGLKIEIRTSILAKVGTWTFAQGSAQPQASGDSAPPASHAEGASG